MTPTDDGHRDALEVQCVESKSVSEIHIEDSIASGDMAKPNERFAALQVFQDGAPRLAVACLLAIDPYYSVNRYLYRYRRVVAAKRAYDQRRRLKEGRPLREEEWYADGSSPGSLTDELFRAKGVVAGDVVRRLVFEGCLVAVADTSPRQYQITEKGKSRLVGEARAGGTPMTGQLAKYEAARAALEAATKIDEVKSIHDKAVAVAAYAKQAKDTDMINWAVEIKVRAERRAGELLKAMPKNVGTAGAGKPPKLGGSKKEPPKDLPPTLAQQGISKKESMTWQKLADIPAPVFEKKLIAVKAQGEKLTTKAVLNLKSSPKPSVKTKASVAKPGSVAMSSWKKSSGGGLSGSDLMATFYVRGKEVDIAGDVYDTVQKLVKRWPHKKETLITMLMVAITKHLGDLEALPAKGDIDHVQREDHSSGESMLYLKQAQTATEGLMTAVRHGWMGLDSLPRMIHRVLTEGYWRERIVTTGERVTNTRFRDYIMKPPHEGIGADPKKIMRMLWPAPQILAMFERAMREQGSGDASEPPRDRN